MASALIACHPLPVLRDFPTAPGAEDYPEAKAVWLERVETVRLSDATTPPSATIEHCYAVKLLTEAAVREQNPMALPYDQTDTRIEAVEGRTVLPGGVSVPVGAGHISDHPVFGADVLYSSTRVRIVEFPGARAGAILQLCYRELRSDLVHPLQFRLQMPEPVMLARVVLDDVDRLRFGSLFREAGVSRPLPPRYARREGRRLAVWERRNLRALPDEPFSPAPGLIAAAIELQPLELGSADHSFRFESSWDGVARRFNGLWESQTAASSEMRALVARLTVGEATPVGKARQIYRHLQAHVRYVAIEYGKGRLQPTAAAETLRREYGDCKDKAALLAGLLRVAGVESRPVLIGTRGERPSRLELAGFAAFDHVIVAVELDHQRVLIDPTSRTSPWGELPPADCDTEALLVEPHRGVLIRTPDSRAQSNTVDVEISLALGDDLVLRGSSMVSGRGQPASRLRHMLITEPTGQHAERVRQALGLGSAVSIAGVRPSGLMDFDSPFQIEATLEASGLLSEHQRLLLLDPAPLVGRVYPPTIGPQRRNPVLFPYRVTLRQRLRLRLPSQAVAKLPEAARLRSRFGVLELTYSEAAPGLIEVVSIATCEQVELGAAEVGELSSFLERGEAALGRPIAIELAPATRPAASTENP